MSCEPGRKVAYSPDLRNRMIWQRIAMELPFRTIAQNLSVSVGTVHNVFKLFEQTGSVDPSKLDRANTRMLNCLLLVSCWKTLVCTWVKYAMK